MTMAEPGVNPKILVNVVGCGCFPVLPGSYASELVDNILSKTDLINGEAKVVAIIVDNTLRDLYYRFYKNCSISLVSLSSEMGIRIYRRSAAFLLIKACKDMYPDRNLIIRHSLSNGLYCEFPNQGITASEVSAVERRMRELVKNNLPIEKISLDKSAAQEIFFKQGQEEKSKLLELSSPGRVELYKLEDYYGYFYGYVVPKTGMVDKFRILHYEPGIILQTPEPSTPNTIQPYKEQKKLASVFNEAKEWAGMLATPHVAALNEKIEAGAIDDIIRVNEALHEKKIALIADQICNNRDIRLVLISGPSSSGKTTFAQRLLIQLRVNGRRPVAVSLDNYFVDRELTPRDENGDYDFESLDALQLDLFNDHLARLIKGEEVFTPVFDFKTGTSISGQNPIKVPKGELIIVEGIHGLNDRLTWIIPKKMKFKVYISALTQLNLDYTNRIPTTDSRLIRRIVRDQRTRGYSAAETIRRWPSVRKGEERYIFPFQEDADVMFNSSLVYELSVLKNHVEPLLRQIGPHDPEFIESNRILRFLSYFKPVSQESIPPNSIIREFIGGSWFRD
ncbi:MAG: nucleoside kinase [Syntrophomonadaceae bacterium]|jgi:uridine kinase